MGVGLRDRRYFLIDKNGKLNAATKARFIELYAPYKSRIEEYLRSEPVNFEKVGDLVWLAGFCAQLGK